MDIREAITRVRTEVCGFIYDCTECISDGCPYYVLLNTAYNVVNSEQTDLLVKTPHKSRVSHEKNCETCRDKDAYDEWQGNCDECENGSMYTPQTDSNCSELPNDSTDCSWRQP